MLDSKKCIWITGASTGIGKTLALKLAEEGYIVAVDIRDIIDQVIRQRIVDFIIDI